MADDVSGLTTRLKTLAPQISMVLSHQYASSQKDYRSRLRTALHERFQEARLLDLNLIPALPSGFVSISHCPSLGGYALSKHPVGFDIEETARVEWRFVERMWHSDDEKGPSAAAHWCAKEAVYKSLGAQQPAIISEIGIAQWKPLNQDTHSFSYQGETGVALTYAQWTLALFGSL